jgi:hypothetical protein
MKPVISFAVSVEFKGHESSILQQVKVAKSSRAITPSQ